MQLTEISSAPARILMASPSHPAPWGYHRDNISQHRLHDVLHLVKEILLARKAFKSLANLIKCNHEFRTVFAPALAGWRIVLNANRAREELRDLLGRESDTSSIQCMNEPN